MTLSQRQKLTAIPLLLYWPTIFVLTHIPIPKSVLENLHASDKILHFLAYLVLAFLLWFAVSPDRKVNWRKATVWWALLAMIGYGVIDEWLQGYVGRNPDVWDFTSNIAGVFTSMVLLSIFSLRLVFFAVTGVVVSILANLCRQLLTG